MNTYKLVRFFTASILLLFCCVSNSFAFEEFYGDIRDQRIQDMEDELLIDESYNDAKNIVLQEKPAKNRGDDIEAVIYTEKEIIQSLLAADLKVKKIDLDFDEVKLSDLFMTIGKAGGINVMVDPDFKNFQIDLHLKQVSIDEAFILIGNAYDLGFKKIGGSLYVTAKDKIKEENIISKVIKLRNIKAEDAKKMIEDMVDTVSSSEEINSIIVQGVPQKIVEVQKVIESIDLPQPQVLLEAKVIELNKDALEEVGVDWSDDVEINYLEALRPDEVSETAKAESLLAISSFHRSAISFTTLFKMLENQNKAKVLSNPRVTTLNENPAEIFVGDRVPYTISTTSGGVTTIEVRWEEPGIRLNITPSIIEDDFVVLKVTPEVSYIYSWIGESTVQYPWVKKRTATAFVRVKDRESFIIGGLLNQEDKKNLYKVPMLGDVPLLGNLFSYEKTTVLDTELIITVTPTVVHGDY